MHTQKSRQLLKLILSISLFIVSTTMAVAQDRFNTVKRFLYIQPGQDIFSIVRVLYPDQQNQWPAIIKNIVRKNPHAFIGADATRIQAGARIELPSKSRGARQASAAQPVVYRGPKAVGQVTRSRGKAFVISKSKQRRGLQVGSEVFVGDRLYTGVNGSVRLNMIDDAKIDLRCNSEMLIEDYQLLRGANRSVLHLLKGSINKVTGSIGKIAEDIYEMHTPMATVGVRGTEYAIRVLQSHGCDGSLDVNSKGLFVRVKQGGIDLRSQQQKLALNQGQAVHMASQQAKAKPIRVEKGVFEAAEADQTRHYFFGSVSWVFPLLILSIMLLRRGYVRD